jgi:hypothetical protein
MGGESTNFSFFLGGLTLMSAVISIILYSRSYLPTNQLKLLDELLRETREIYDKSIAQDLIPNETKVELDGTLRQ